MHLELEADDHIDIGTRCLTCSEHANSGDVERRGATIECACVISAL